ncbi:MAG TPA: alpha-amylase family glycosyl hydrolase [Verrucomicrobiae bacterium]|jgi:glycosidase|nr:alpha-amylase family glycosyl hydrolase [Verrucomicrobiae bacterium]
MKRCVALALTLFAWSLTAQTNDLWRQQTIYQIITDRFFDGDPSNNNADGNYNPARARAPHGGDFRGLEQKLDYIKALGATAIWISPVVRNGHGEYHGYAGRNFLETDPRWGTIDDLRRMVAAAHQRGLLVIDDIIVNHGADLIDSADPGYGAFRGPPDGYRLRYKNPALTYPPPFNLTPDRPDLTNLFHNHGLIHDFADEKQVRLGELAGLDDFRTESPYVRAQMERIYEFWIEQAGFDGFRIDTVKHVEMDFWRQWCPAIRAFAAAHGKPQFFMFGEVLDPSDKLCASFTGPGLLDATLDYPLFFKTQNVFARAQAGTAEISHRYEALAENYPSSVPPHLVTFLDNHDQPRFLSREFASHREERLRAALVFLLTAPGIPCLYYGTEQGFAGGNDPYDREDMFAGAFKDTGAAGVDSFNMTHPLFRLVAMLNNLRRIYAPLRVGDFKILTSSAEAGALAYVRSAGSNELIVALNTSAMPQNLPEFSTSWAQGAQLVNLLDTNETTVTGAGGKVQFSLLPPNGCKIFTLVSNWKALDPVVTDCFPPHDAKNVLPAQSVQLDFSERMDAASVEHAFMSSPPRHGAFMWSPDFRRATFAPDAPWPAGTIIEIRVAESARAGSTGRKFCAPFAMRFQTAAP